MRWIPTAPQPDEFRTTPHPQQSNPPSPGSERSRVSGRLAALLTAFSVLVSACGGSTTDLALSNYDTLTLTLVSGTLLEGTVGVRMSNAVQIQVTDETGRPVPEVPVEFEVSPENGRVSPTRVRSDSQGIIETEWTLGETVGSQNLLVQPGENRLSRLWRRFPVRALAHAPKAHSLEVQPGSAALEVGVTQAFHPEVRDPFGNDITHVLDAETEWSSDDPDVARVSYDGVVTATGPGETLIRAKVQGPMGGMTEDYASLTVSAGSEGAGDPDEPEEPDTPDQPSTGEDANPPDAGDPDDPDGDGRDGDGGVDEPLDPPVEEREATTALFQDSFESGDLAHGENGFSWQGGRRTKVSSAAAYSGEHSLRFRFGPDGSGEDSFAEQRFSFAESEEVWIEYWILYPKTYVHRAEAGPDNNKFFQLNNSSGGNMLTVETLPNDAAGWSDLKRFLSESERVDGSRNWPVGTGGSRSIIGPEGAISLGEWAQVRIHYRSGSSGHAELRINGEVVQALDWPFWRPDNHGRVDGGYVLGWANSGFADETYIHMDDFKIFVTDPRW